MTCLDLDGSKTGLISTSHGAPLLAASRSLPAGFSPGWHARTKCNQGETRDTPGLQTVWKVRFGFVENRAPFEERPHGKKKLPFGKFFYTTKFVLQGLRSPGSAKTLAKALFSDPH